MQAVILEQERTLALPARPADKLAGISQRYLAAILESCHANSVTHGDFDAVADYIAMTCTIERNCIVEKRCRLADDLRPANRVVPTTGRPFVIVGNDVGSIKRIIETAPAGICSIYGESRVAERYLYSFCGCKSSQEKD